MTTTTEPDPACFACQSACSGAVEACLGVVVFIELRDSGAEDEPGFVVRRLQRRLQCIDQGLRAADA